MANICANILTLTGPTKELSQTYKALAQHPSVEEITEAYNIQLGRWDEWALSKEQKRIIIYVSSAWQPADVLAAGLSEAFPTLRLTHDYCEQGNGFAGRAFYQHGEKLTEHKGLPHHHYGLFTENDDWLQELETLSQELPPNHPRPLPVFKISGWKKPIRIPAETDIEAAAAFLFHHTQQTEESTAEQLDAFQSDQAMVIERLDVAIDEPTKWTVTITPTNRKQTAPSQAFAREIVHWWNLKSL